MAVVVTASVAGVQSLRARKQLEGAAQELAADVNGARARSLGSLHAVQLLTAADGRSYRLLSCSGVNCPVDGVLLKRLDLSPGLSVSGNRSFTFNAPRGELSGGTQRVCLTVSGSSQVLQVNVGAALEGPTVCAVGAADRGLPACLSACP